MSAVHIIGSRVATVALVLLGAGAGIASFADDTPVDAAPTAPASVPAAQPVGTLTVVPELGVPTVLACRTEEGPEDGLFRWRSCVPDESPDGGPVVYIGEDGAASYRDGWTIAPVNESATGTVVGAWTSPQTDPAPDCDTDAECAAWDESHGRAATGYGAELSASTRRVETVAMSGGGCREPLPAPGAAPAPAPAAAPQSRPLVNVNTASVAELDALPGIGDVLADRIVAQRPYASVNDLHRVARIPAKVFPLVTV